MNIKHAKFKAQVRLLQASPDLLKALKDLVSEVELDFPENEFVARAKHEIFRAEGMKL